MKKGLLIGVAGVARAGKDSFANLATKIAEKEGISVSRYAFADALKAKIEPTLQALGYTAYETNSIKKAIIRPMLVDFGVKMRKESKGMYWINQIAPNVKKDLDEGKLVFVTDVRFAEYDFDEVDWIHYLGGKLVHITRLDRDNNEIPPANQEEAVNNPKLLSKANVKIIWPTVEKDIDSLLPMVYDAWTQLGVCNEQQSNQNA